MPIRTMFAGFYIFLNFMPFLVDPHKNVRLWFYCAWNVPGKIEEHHDEPAIEDSNWVFPEHESLVLPLSYHP
jgi:hypothetical protein